jgi:hypothetical protein
MTRALLIDSGLDKERFWEYALQTAIYLSNRSPTKSNGGNKTPYEKLTRRKPDLSKLRIFGETCYVQVPKHKRTKLDDKAHKCRIIGYTDFGYIVLDTETDTTYQSSHVRFVDSPADTSHEESDEENETDSDSDEDQSRKKEITSNREPETDDEFEDPDENLPELIPDEPEQAPSPPRRPAKERSITVIEPADKKAPKDINSKIDPGNIIEGSRQRHAYNAIYKEPENNVEGAIEGA